MSSHFGGADDAIENLCRLTVRNRALYASLVGIDCHTQLPMQFYFATTVLVGF